jgi:ABC-type antimicrobial peptide transport system permease subunit
MEVYQVWVKEQGKRKADIRFIIEVMLLFRPGIIGSADRHNNANNYTMIKSYFKIGWRNLLKNRGYSLINIGGLTMGMGVAMLIGLWIYDELEFNKSHENYNRIARVMKNGTLNGDTHTSTHLPYALGDELQTKYDNSFKHVVMAWPVGDHILSAGEQKASLSGEFIQPAGPEMFSLKMLEGAWSGLDDPHSIFLSESAAKAFFGNGHAIDRLLNIDNNMDVKVTGVYEDFPHNSHFRDVKFFAPWDLLVSVNEWIKYQGFGNNFLDIYVELEDRASIEAASDQIKDVILDNIPEGGEYATMNPQLFLHPMKKWHLWSEWKNGVNAGGLIQTVWLFGIVGIFVLLLACINFMNLSTARSEKRAKEVGIRKAIGSARTQIIHQFFSESFLVVLLAFVFAFFLVTTSLEWFNDLAGKQIEMLWGNAYFWLSSGAFILLTGFVAGSYPAFYLSSFNSVRVLKGSMHVGRFASLPRKVLVVVQFTVSVTLIIETIIVYQQIQFAKDRPIGYDRNGLLMVQMTSPDFQGKYEALRTELKNTGMVTEVAESSSPLTDIWNSNGGFNWKGKDPDYIPEFGTFTVTPEYGKTVGWQFVEGRDFLKEMVSDSSAFIINEAAAKVFGFEQPVGEVVQWQNWWTNGVKDFVVIGVIKDVVMKSPYAPPIPSVFFLGGPRNWLAIRVDPRVSTNDALSRIEAVFKNVIPSVPFDYAFADQEYALKFAAEERVGKLASVFAILAILISCMGLFGLASFIAEQRTKEIGIRKVVGASVFNLWKLLSKDFIILVAISCLIAIPIAHYFLTEWLIKFEYRTELTWWIFAVTSIAALVITLLTVSYQAVKAARMNPVKSLRSE